jgi:low affinity Fe/Cu permease
MQQDGADRDFPVGLSCFTRFAQTVARISARPGAVIAAAAVSCVGSRGAVLSFQRTWLLAINTATTVVTFLMVFLIQHTQNRDAAAVQLKLSELLLAMQGAESRIAAVEHLSDEELEILPESINENL